MFSGLTVFEFINHYKVTFFSARTCPNFSHFPRQVKHVHFPSILHWERERPKKYSLLSAFRRELCGPGPFYYLTEMNIYTWNLLVCNSGQFTYVTGLCNFFFVLQDLIDRTDSYFQRIAFSKEFASYWLVTLYVTSFFQWK